jgi:hypothetical protein
MDIAAPAGLLTYRGKAYEPAHTHARIVYVSARAIADSESLRPPRALHTKQERQVFHMTCSNGGSVTLQSSSSSCAMLTLDGIAWRGRDLCLVMQVGYDIDVLLRSL